MRTKVCLSPIKEVYVEWVVFSVLCIIWIQKLFILKNYCTKQTLYLFFIKDSLHLCKIVQIIFICFFTVTFVKSVSNKELALFCCYAFYRHGRNKNTDIWDCTRGQGCKASIVMTKNKEIIRLNPDHNHPPPKYVIRNGIFIRVKSFKILLFRVLFLRMSIFEMHNSSGYTYL